MRNITEKPESWVILKIEGSETYYRVFGGWRGGYLDDDRWKMNSGIVGIEEDDDYYYFEGHSGSCYQCHKNGYGLKDGMYYFSSYVQSTLELIIEKSPVPIEVVDEETDFINLLEAQIGNRSGVDLSEEDIKLIIETNENPPPPNEKLKEAFKQYKTDMNMTNKEKLILDILTKDLESIIKVGEEQEEMLKDLRDNGYGDIHPFHRDEMKSGISYTHGYSVGHKCLAEQVIELLKMTEDEITSKIEDDKRIEEENKKYMEDLLKSFKDKNDE